MGDGDRRRSPRISAELHVELTHIGRPHETVADVTRNMSDGGIFVDTSVGLQRGTEVALAISPGLGRAPVLLRAEVVRVEEERSALGTRTRGMALRFVHGDPAELQLLLKLVERLGSKRGGEC